MPGRALTLAARAISLAAIVVAGFMVICIVLVMVAPSLKPFPVGLGFEATQWLAGPFDGIFPIRPTGLYVLANWGLAALVWFALGQIPLLLVRRIEGRLGAGASGAP